MLGAKKNPQKIERTLKNAIERLRTVIPGKDFTPWVYA
jgi:hypothetical protein